MPKRGAQEKINYYKAKIKKLSHKQRSNKRYQRVIISSSSESDSEINIENGSQYDDTLPLGDTETRSRTPPPLQSSLARRSPSTSPPHELPDENVLPAQEVGQEPELELDSELLEALGDASEETPAYGPDIHCKLAQRWLPILKKGLPSDSKGKLLKDYAIPDNCRLLKAPTVNPEILAAVTDIVKNRDKKIQTEQDQLGLGMTAINRAMTTLLTQGDKVQAVKVLSDGCRILADLHYAQTQVRTKLITRGLDKAFLSLIQEQDRDETLFGKELPEKIKASKAIERQGHHIKKVPTAKPSTSATPSSSGGNRNRYQGNWSGPPRFQSSTRGGRLTQYRNQYRRTPLSAPSNTPPQTARQATSTSSHRRAPTRQ